MSGKLAGWKTEVLGKALGEIGLGGEACGIGCFCDVAFFVQQHFLCFFQPYGAYHF